MALSSWNALYTQVEQKFMFKRQWRELNLLRALVQHADEFGLCHPGEERLSDLTGIGTHKALNETLEFLVDGEYVKLYDVWNPFKRIWERQYQISPLKMYIREELQGYCEKVWNGADRDFDFESTVVIKRKGQPTSESESESTSDNQHQNQHQNQHHHPAKNAAKQLTTDAPAQDYTNQPEGQKPRRRRKTGAIQPQKETAHAGGSAPVPEKIDLRRYRSPLPRPMDEDYANDLVHMFRMRITQARGLVGNYGQDAVSVAALAVKEAMDDGRCFNPPGLLTHLLKKGGSSTEDRQLYDDQDRARAMAAETQRLITD